MIGNDVYQIESFLHFLGGFLSGWQPCFKSISKVFVFIYFDILHSGVLFYNLLFLSHMKIKFNLILFFTFLV